MAEVDLLVVGGGPAGLATAIRARQAGLSVILLEKRTPPIDRACGEGLLPSGVAALATLGIELPAAARFPFAGIRFIDLEQSATGSFSTAPGVAIRRTVLHGALVRRAEEVGVDARWGVRATAVLPGAVKTKAGWTSAEVIVVAQGRTSPVRSDDHPRRGRRHGVRRHVNVRPWSDRVEVIWGSGAQAYVTPVGEDEVGVALLSGRGPGRFDDLLPLFPCLAERLAGAPVTSRDLGATGFDLPPLAFTAAGVALVGDAGGCVDPITGAGVSLALEQSIALVDAVVAGLPDRYRRAHRGMHRTARAMAGSLLLLANRPRLRARVINVLAREPRLFGRLLDAHGSGQGGSTRLALALAPLLPRLLLRGAGVSSRGG